MKIHNESVLVCGNRYHLCNPSLNSKRFAPPSLGRLLCEQRDRGRAPRRSMAPPTWAYTHFAVGRLDELDLQSKEPLGGSEEAFLRPFKAF